MGSGEQGVGRAGLDWKRGLRAAILFGLVGCLIPAAIEVAFMVCR